MQPSAGRNGVWHPGAQVEPFLPLRLWRPAPCRKGVWYLNPIEPPPPRSPDDNRKSSPYHPQWPDHRQGAKPSLAPRQAEPANDPSHVRSLRRVNRSVSNTNQSAGGALSLETPASIVLVPACRQIGRAHV